MNFVDNIDEFLATKGLIWCDRKVYDNNKEEFISLDKCKFGDSDIALLVKMKGADDSRRVLMNVEISLLDFYTYGVSFSESDLVICAPTDEEYDIFSRPQEWSDDWMNFNLRTNGEEYSEKVTKYLNKQKSNLKNTLDKELESIEKQKQKAQSKYLIEMSKIDAILNKLTLTNNEDKNI